jgi:hypothetical protein
VGHTARIEELPAIELSGLAGERGIAALAAAFARMSEEGTFDVAFVDDWLVQAERSFPGYFAHWAPLAVSLSEGVTVDAFEAKAVERLAGLRRRHGFPADLISRNPKLTAPSASVAFRLAESPETASAVDGAILTFARRAPPAASAHPGRRRRLRREPEHTHRRSAADVAGGSVGPALRPQPDGARL